MGHRTGASRSGRSGLIGTLVEFIGLPGSGKSTLQRELLQNTTLPMMGPYYSRSSASRVLSRRLLGTAHVIVALVSRWRLSWLVLCRLQVEGPKRSLEGLRRTFGVVVEAQRGLAQEPSSITVLDEGPLQRALRVFVLSRGGPAPATAQLERFLATIPRSQVVIHVRTPVSTCIERVRTRASGLPARLTARTDPELIDMFTAMDEILDQLVTMLRKEGYTTIVDDAGDDGSLRSRISPLIEAIGRAHSATPSPPEAGAQS